MKISSRSLAPMESSRRKPMNRPPSIRSAKSLNKYKLFTFFVQSLLSPKLRWQTSETQINRLFAGRVDTEWMDSISSRENQTVERGARRGNEKKYLKSVSTVDSPRRLSSVAGDVADSIKRKLISISFLGTPVILHWPRFSTFFVILKGLSHSRIVEKSLVFNGSLGPQK